MRRLSILVILASATSLGAAGPIRVLLPVYFEQPVQGAFGSIWNAQLAVHNSSGCDYRIANCPYTTCEAFDSEDLHLRPGETQTVLPASYPKRANGVAGSMLYLQADAATCSVSNPATDLWFALRIMDSSRAVFSAGTELPVVRENAFYHGALRLLDIPTGSLFRSTLRVFEMDLTRAAFTVRVFDQTTNVLVSEFMLTAAAESPGGPSGPPLDSNYRFYPGFAEAPITVDVSSHPVRVEVNASSAGAVFWAYISITNNDSQQVTVVTPQ